MSLLLKHRASRRQFSLLGGAVQERLVVELRDEIERLELPRSHEDSPWWQEIRDRVVGDIRSKEPRKFLTWRPIRETMFTANEPFVDDELRVLQASADWETRWRPVLEEDPSGCPPPYPPLPGSSANLVHHAFHAHALEAAARTSLAEYGQIVEFGGGYGSFARLAFRLGFRGLYHVHDFPEFTALQRFYLGSVAAVRGETALIEHFSTSSDGAEGPLFDLEGGTLRRSVVPKRDAYSCS